MAKRQNKSIADLLGKKNVKPSLEEINKIADKIHTPKIEKQKTPLPPSNRTKRISLNTPIELYLEIQRAATLQGKSMMQYILETVKADIDNN